VRQPTPHPLPVILATILSATTLPLLTACSSTPKPAIPTQSDLLANVNTVAHDRDVWTALLANNAKIRRTVTYTATGVEATTESDDRAVVALLQNHARAMKNRMQAGAPVRVWDDVFADLFKKHQSVTINVTNTEKGVTITESCTVLDSQQTADPETVSLLWSHAAGVSEFVRSAERSGHEPTHRIPAGSTPPPAELAIGGVPHRILLTQPTAQQLVSLQAMGAKGVLNFRHAAEHPDYNEQAAATSTGLSYCNLPYKQAEELTDELLSTARTTLRESTAKNEPLVLHCRTGNRVGAAWACWRALDCSIPVEQAISEAKAMGMNNPAYETKARAYIAQRAATPKSP
jgi:uncharacterized protein (TIGR01244 family)